MPRTVEFYFDYGSPYSYIGHVRLPAVLQRAPSSPPTPHAGAESSATR